MRQRARTHMTLSHVRHRNLEGGDQKSEELYL